MKKVILLSILIFFANAEDIDILNKNKKELKNTEKEIIYQNYENLKNEWISPLSLSGSLNRGHTFDSEDDNFSQNVSLGFSQSIFEFGGIELSIDFAKNKLYSDLIFWESDIRQQIEIIYDILLNIKKTKLQIEQNVYNLDNRKIELDLRKIEYENGKGDIVDLNNAIVAKNSTIREDISLKNLLVELEFELSKYTSLKYEQIKPKDFSKISKDEYIEKNLDLLYQQSLIELAKTTYERDKTNYYPKVALNGDLSYTNNEDLDRHSNIDNASSSIGLRVSMPLFDINKSSNLQLSRLDVIKQKLELEDFKNEHKKEFDKTLSAINKLKKQNEVIEEDIKLYDELIEINEASASSGMSSIYDLEILKNTQKINGFNIKINEINIQQEYAKLYFKIKEEKNAR